MSCKLILDVALPCFRYPNTTPPLVAFRLCFSRGRVNQQTIVFSPQNPPVLCNHPVSSISELLSCFRTVGVAVQRRSIPLSRGGTVSDIIFLFSTQLKPPLKKLKVRHERRRFGGFLSVWSVSVSVRYSIGRLREGNSFTMENSCFHTRGGRIFCILVVPPTPSFRYRYRYGLFL